MGSLTVHVLDEDQEPVSGKKVFCNFVASYLGILPTNSTEYTDEDGIAEFDDIPTGEVQIYVAGEEIDISVGQNDHEDVTFTI